MYRIRQSLVGGLQWVSLILTTFFISSLLELTPVFAQQPTTTANAERPLVTVQTVGNPGGLRSYSPGRWGVVLVSANNRSEETQSILATASIQGYEELRFSRRVVVPAKTVRTTTIPIHVPADIPSDQVLEIVGSVGGENGLPAANTVYLARLFRPAATAFIRDFEITLKEPEFDTVDHAYEAVVAMRNSTGLNRMLTVIDDRSIPSTMVGWDSVRSIVMSGDRIAGFPSVQQSLRQWLAEGGKMWIQANQTSPDTIRKLLGAAIDFEEVDRVYLNDFDIAMGGEAGLSFPTKVSLESPVEFIRMIVENADVMYEIDGWPAMFRIEYGEGVVFFTTLDNRGWLRERSSSDPPFDDPMFYSDLVALEPLKDLSTAFHQPDEGESLSKDLQQAFVTSRIGYEVPSRGLIVGSLILFCGLIAGTGVFLNQFRLREYLAVVSLVAGIATTALILVSGWNSKRDVPPTASSLQLIELFPGTAEYSSSGEIAFFQGDQNTASLKGTEGTRIDPQFPQLAGNIRNFIWTDDEKWAWSDTPLPSGIQTFEIRSRGSLSDSVYANAKFGSRGLEGAINLTPLAGETPEFSEDAIIVFPHSPALAANLNSTGQFSAAPRDILAPGQFSSTTFVTSAQRRQQKIFQAWYDDYIQSGNENSYLLTWCNSIGTDLQWEDNVRVIDESLVVMPLEIEASQQDSQIQIPAPAIRMRAVVSKTGQSSVFDNDSEAWIYPYSRSTNTRIRFQIPPEALPLSIESATLDIDCNIPSRELVIKHIGLDRETIIASRLNPSGRLSFEIVKDESIKLDDGGLVLEFSVGELMAGVEEATMANSAWSIRSTRLSVSGTHQTNETVIEAE